MNFGQKLKETWDQLRLVGFNTGTPEVLQKKWIRFQ